MTKIQQDLQDARKERIMPNGIPRWVRIYDNGGTDVKNGTCDRYTVVYTGNYNEIGKPKHSPHTISPHLYVGMSSNPFHPQGICQHGEELHQSIDTLSPSKQYVWPPAIGRKCHLGLRISFSKLPVDCQKLVLQDYKEIWDIT